MLLAGEVGKPHGLAGEVYVVVISDDPQRFAPGAHLSRDDGSILTVATSRAHGDRFLVRFEGIDSREATMALRGPLYVPATDARALDEDEFWHDDLIGCTVVTASGDELGVVEMVIAGPAQDLLQVETPNGRRLVPVVKEIVTNVDPEGKRIVVDPPEGLFD
ncbi:MAG: rRNA processing protein RimM [Actinomycetota bacterium]|jgi:16S rRNA processing protein RimM|nr:rRNA processing protein RimM [Actinomycetota bacterium]